MHRPVVLIPACSGEIDLHGCNYVETKYIDAILSSTGCMPLVLPAIGSAMDWETLLPITDGLLLTGSTSNVHPRYYEEDLYRPDILQDLARDETTLPLIRAVVHRGIPLLAICRGFQETNVALGGSLYQAVHDITGMMDHRERLDTTLEIQYAPIHRVAINPSGKLSQILDGTPEIMVNSLHGQGINRLAPGLLVEACTDDGLIEAYSIAGAPGFALAVQWHPEWKIAENPHSMKLFIAFGQACREYQSQKNKRKGLDLPPFLSKEETSHQSGDIRLNH